MPTLYDNFERVRQYIDQHSGSADLSSYVSYAYLASKNYITMTDVSACGYLTSVPSEYITQDELSANGYISSIPSEYITQDELSANGYISSIPSEYITDSELSGMSYITMTDVSACGYLTSVPSEYITQDELSANGYISSIPSEYATKSYVAEYVATYAPEPDLSAYVSKVELSACGYLTSIPAEYVTDSELSGMSYITMGDVSACGYLTSVPSEYITQDELSANGYISSIPAEYITDSELSGMSYITMTDVSACGYLTSVPSEYITESELSAMSYATTSQLPVIDENLIPKTNNTYSLGSDNKRYLNAYTRYLYSDNAIYSNDIYGSWIGCEEGAGLTISGSGGLGIESDDNIGFYPEGQVYSRTIVPDENNTYSLGSSSLKWNNTYTNNLFTTYLAQDTYSNSILPKETATYTLGNSTYSFAATYTGSLYLHPSNGWINVSNWQTKFRIDNFDKYYLTSNRFYPGTNEGASLGLSNQRFLNTYTANLYVDNAYTNNIVPNENLTYQLGDATHNFKATYTSSLKSNDSGITIQINNNNKYYISSSAIRPITANNTDLGTSNYPFGVTYTSNIYTENVTYTSGKTSLKMNDRNIDIYANNKKLVNISDYNGFIPMQTGVNLGSSANSWAATYTSNLYTDTAYISSATYLPKNTYWYNGSSYVWLGSL